MSTSIRAILYSTLFFLVAFFLHSSNFSSISHRCSRVAFFSITLHFLSVHILPWTVDTLITKKNTGNGTQKKSLTLISQIQYSFRAFKSFLESICNGAGDGPFGWYGTIHGFVVNCVCPFGRFRAIENTLMYFSIVFFLFSPVLFFSSWSLVYILFPIPLVYLVADCLLCRNRIYILRRQLFMWVVSAAMGREKKEDSRKKYR